MSRRSSEPNKITSRAARLVVAYPIAAGVPYLHFLVDHTVSSSPLGRDAARRPRPSTRAPRGIFCCRRASALCNDWPVVAALLLVLSLVVTKVRNSAATGPPAWLWLNRASCSRRELCCTAGRRFRHGHLKETKGLLEKTPNTFEHPQEVYRCDYFNQHQEWPSGSQIERVPFSRLRAA